MILILFLISYFIIISSINYLSIIESYLFLFNLILFQYFMNLFLLSHNFIFIRIKNVRSYYYLNWDILHRFYIFN